MAWAATARISDGKLHRTYRGPHQVRPSGTPMVTEMVKAGDFEAVLTWVIGPGLASPSGSLPSTIRPGWS